VESVTISFACCAQSANRTVWMLLQLAMLASLDLTLPLLSCGGSWSSCVALFVFGKMTWFGLARGCFILSLITLFGEAKPQVGKNSYLNIII